MNKADKEYAVKRIRTITEKAVARVAERQKEPDPNEYIQAVAIAGGDLQLLPLSQILQTYRAKQTMWYPEKDMSPSEVFAPPATYAQHLEQYNEYVKAAIEMRMELETLSSEVCDTIMLGEGVTSATAVIAQYQKTASAMVDKVLDMLAAEPVKSAKKRAPRKKTAKRK